MRPQHSYHVFRQLEQVTNSTVDEWRPTNAGVTLQASRSSGNILSWPQRLLTVKRGCLGSWQHWLVWWVPQRLLTRPDTSSLS